MTRCSLSRPRPQVPQAKGGIAAALLAGAFLLAIPASAASLQTESFADGLGGWNNGSDAATWAEADGCLQVSFPAVGGAPVMVNADLEGGATASAGAVHGDWTAAGVEMIGLHFKAESVNPCQLILEVVSGDTVYEAFLQDHLAPPGSWNRIAVSLTNRTAGPWGGPANDASFEAALRNVTAVHLKVFRKGTGVETYELDNLFLARLHETASADISPAGETELTWSGLRPDWNYRVEYCTNLVSNVWQPMEAFSATDTVYSFADDDATNGTVRIYRLRMERY